VLEVTNIRVRSFDVGYLDIYWDIKPVFEDVNNYEFIVQKSENEFGPYHDLTVPVVNTFHIRDNTVRGQFSFYHKIYYRVKVRRRDDDTVSKTWPELGGAKLAAKPDLAALEMARLNNLRLKEFSGRQLWVYPRKKAGQRCRICFDEVSQRRLRSGCSVCFDTGWVGGYYAPITTHGLVVSPDESVIHANFGDVQNENTVLFAGNYPELSEGDIVVEAENIRWRIGSTINKIKKARALVRQQAQIHRVPKGDIEYTIPLNLTEIEVKDLLASPERNYTNPQSLESDNLASALNNIYGKRV